MKIISILHFNVPNLSLFFLFKTIYFLKKEKKYSTIWKSAVLINIIFGVANLFDS